MGEFGPSAGSGEETALLASDRNPDEWTLAVTMANLEMLSSRAEAAGDRNAVSRYDGAIALLSPLETTRPMASSLSPSAH